jgi:hypothetical protein
MIQSFLNLKNKKVSYLRQLRPSVISFACLRGLPECVKKAKYFYNNLMLQDHKNS